MQSKSKILNSLTAGTALPTFALLAGLAMSSAHAATLFNVDFNHDGSGTAPPSFPSGTMTGAAATGTAGDIWNGLTRGDGTAVSLVDSNGNASSLTVTVNLAETHGSWDNDLFAATDAVALMADYISINDNNNGATATVDVSGLALNADYTIHLFGAGDAADQLTEFNVVGANESAQSTLGGSATALASPQHYVTFTGNTGAAGEIEIEWSHGGTWTAFNGFQLDVVPEPSSAVLLGLAGIGFLFRRNKK